MLEYSKNDRAGEVMGYRPTNVVPFDMPCELGYRCPVCGPDDDDRFEDERLEWSEYNGFLWCCVCNVDYPSAFCISLSAEKDPDRPWVYAGMSDAISVYLSTVARAKEEEPNG